jgi:penicillin-binding protein activator
MPPAFRGAEAGSHIVREISMTRNSRTFLRWSTLLLAVVITSGGCARTVIRMAPEQALDLSGRWNDVDSRLVAEEMIRQSLTATHGTNWAMRFSQSNGGRPPTVIVGTIRNRTMEHIPVGTFVRDLERAFVNSAQVQVVASRAERHEVRDEREDQQEFAAPESRARLAREAGAQYMLQGDIEAIEDRRGRTSVVYYQVDLTLIDLESNAKTWVGQHEIKKLVQRPRVRL